MRQLYPGWHYIPVNPNSKQCFVEKWQERWFSNEELSTHLRNGGNIGVVCDGDFFVVDVDDVDKFTSWIKSIGIDLNELLHSTYSVKTASGKYHLYFRKTTQEPSRRKFPDYGCEIRWGAQYVVCPPSSINGAKYELISDAPIADCPVFLQALLWVKNNVVDTETWLEIFDEIATDTESKLSDNIFDDIFDDIFEEELELVETDIDWTNLPADVRASLRALYRFLKDHWNEGIRHDASLYVAGLLAKLGVPKDFVVDKFLEHIAKTTGDTEWEDRKRAVEDTYENAQNGKPVKGIRGLLELFPDEADKVVLRGIITMLEQAIKNHTQKPLLIRLKDYPVKRRQQLVGKIIYTGDLVLIYGKPKAGKSFLAGQLAYAVATGTNFLDMPVNPIDGSVCLLVYEDPRSYRRRLERLGEIPDNIFMSHPTAHLSARNMDVLIQEFEKHSVRLVVVDLAVDFFAPTLPNSMPFGTEYASTREALLKLRPIQEEMDITVILVHHARKSNQINADDIQEVILGSTALAGSIDVGLYLHRRQEDNERIAMLQWWGREIAEGKLTLYQTDTGFWELADPSQENILLPESILRILQKYYPNPIGIPQILEELEGFHNPDTVRKTLSRLTHSGKVIRTDRGKYKVKIVEDDGADELSQDSLDII